MNSGTQNNGKLTMLFSNLNALTVNTKLILFKCGIYCGIYFAVFFQFQELFQNFQGLSLFQGPFKSPFHFFQAIFFLSRMKVSLED